MADNKNLLECPVCGKGMKKVFINSFGFDVDICTDGCGGMFFDKAEVESFIQQHKEISEVKLYTDKFYKVHKNNIRECPLCHKEMRKIVIPTTNVEIDICDTCQGKFLDKGELDKLCS